jgi:hypothetical protein
MMSHDGDDFWQASNIKPFDFDDEEKQIPPVKTPESVLSVKPSNEPFLRPSMITCQRRLDLIEHLAKDVPDVKSYLTRQDPKSYILDIVNKKVPIDFSPYKSKSEKLALLDAAMCCYDGNVITAVTIFLSKTLKESIFNEELQKRPIALDHYKSFRELSQNRSSNSSSLKR